MHKLPTDEPGKKMLGLTQCSTLPSLRNQGNVRQFINALEYAAIICRSDTVGEKAAKNNGRSFPIHFNNSKSRAI